MCTLSDSGLLDLTHLVLYICAETLSDITVCPGLPTFEGSCCDGTHMQMMPAQLSNPCRTCIHIQVEEVVAGTNTGMSLSLAGYYHYWEKCIFNAITKCIISSMATFLALLQSKDRPPLCEVKANLNGKDLVVTPTVNDIYKYLTKSVKHIVESARMFVRWMHGTCCQTAPQVSKMCNARRTILGEKEK